jgi:hypothetical protein
MIRKQPSVHVTLQQARMLITRHGAKLHGAGLHQVMGPHHRPIIWVQQGKGKMPNICDNMSIAQIRNALLDDII